MLGAAVIEALVNHVLIIFAMTAFKDFAAGWLMICLRLVLWGRHIQPLGTGRESIRMKDTRLHAWKMKCPRCPGVALMH
jgi:hypothetical protein